jgi:nucleotide-binding universal stress UspA family protein
MSTSAKNQHPRARTAVTRSVHPSQAVARIAVGVDGYPEGQDAAALGRAISDVTGAELMLVTVQPEPLVVLPAAMDWKSVREWARHALATTRDQLAPAARIIVETDNSVARALQRVASREHRDLLIVGSTRHAAVGRAQIGKRTRQLLD